MTKPPPKLVAMLRVKNGMLFLPRWTGNIGPLVDEIVVVDNGSTDGTCEYLQRCPKVVSLDRTEGFDEGRDKILAHRRARERNADWILWLDVDEIFEDRMTRRRLEKMMSSKRITRYFFRRFHHQGDERHFRADRIHLIDSSRFSRVLWKNQPGGYFSNARIHNGLIQGIRGWVWPSTIRIRHFVYLDEYMDYVARKTETYIQLDPARAKMYIRHRDQNLSVWPWYEFSERPWEVVFQICVLSLLVFAQIPWRITRKVTRRRRTGRRGISPTRRNAGNPTG